MKKLYYFCPKQLRFIEVKNIRSHFFILLPAVIIYLSLIIFGINRSITPNYKGEHEVMKKKVDEILSLYQTLNQELDSLTSKNNSLRVAVNLSPLSKDEMLIGTGGGSFDNSIDFLPLKTDVKLTEAITYVEQVERKISFEKNQYENITNQLKLNQQLSYCLPAIRPCTGELSDGFGMRMHPILHRLRMHDGIDIVTNVGAPVHTTGNGVVEFTGYDGGYGLTVIVNHGFGYRTIYGHLSKIKAKKGSKVVRGDIIALSGNSGLSTGPHLHYEVEHDGQKLDPTHFFFKKFNYFASIAKN
jgi:murein DD-endopeptidase MepM/ murein hydrolase activator NlpD